MEGSNPIKKILQKQITPDVHRVFVRYSVGEFEKEPFKIKKEKERYLVKAGFEYLNFFHQFLSRNLKSKEITIEGAIESIKNLASSLKEKGLVFSEKKRFGKPGKKFIFKKQKIPFPTYLKIIKEFFGEYLLLEVKTEEASLKLKSLTTPKLGQLTENFITLELSPSLFLSFKEDYLFDIGEEFKEAVIKHWYFIEEISVDENLLKTNPEKARKEAKRKGRILREIYLNGKKFKKYEIKFEA